ncbi:hypothetical protein PVAP13_9NG543014 [Panicum virgatum]|uniref:Disease resistance R13L4/SHOC-2-like LRR domain-containing protein n=1 Tax=Panicum virgatum TaxID=38727 RepID=A0A8T0MU39_PANVG|nr:hypothetical protein PVAP13_9NG543014 [Panicum virgatum]
MTSMPPEMIHILVNMTSLVNVYLDTFESLHQLPESRHFPQGLRELRLFADAIEQDPMPILEKLPCLVVLLLQGYQGPTMVCSAQGFPQLQELELHLFYVKEWRMEVKAMPKLSRLQLYLCRNMKKLPEGLLHLPSLKELELWVVYPDSEEDVTRKKLQGRGCKVITIERQGPTYLPPSQRRRESWLSKEYGLRTTRHW